MVGGISAGGNFGTVVSHLYRDEKLSPPLTGVYLSIPACIGPDTVPAKYKDVYLSREQNKNAPILNAESMALFDSKSTLPYLELMHVLVRSNHLFSLEVGFVALQRRRLTFGPVQDSTNPIPNRH